MKSFGFLRNFQINKKKIANRENINKKYSYDDIVDYRQKIERHKKSPIFSRMFVYLLVLSIMGARFIIEPSKFNVKHVG